MTDDIALFCEGCGLHRDQLTSAQAAGFATCRACGRSCCSNCWNQPASLCLRCAPFWLPSNEVSSPVAREAPEPPPAPTSSGAVARSALRSRLSGLRGVSRGTALAVAAMLGVGAATALLAPMALSGTGIGPADSSPAERSDDQPASSVRTDGVPRPTPQPSDVAVPTPSGEPAVGDSGPTDDASTDGTGSSPGEDGSGPTPRPTTPASTAKPTAAPGTAPPGSGPPSPTPIQSADPSAVPSPLPSAEPSPTPPEPSPTATPTPDPSPEPSPDPTPTP